MTRLGEWFELQVAEAGPGTRYRFRIDDEIEIPDPASHFQPEDVNGPSEVIDHAGYAWTTNDWKGLPWEQAVFLEAHVGTFTPAGTFRAMIDRLDHLAETGITALELMPVADFPGRWNWGYDGVLLYAPDSSYGRPNDLKALIDAAHARGIMLFLDVVYNHFGPEGNHLHRIAPTFFSDEHHTPWGVAIDYRVPEVRAYAIENALHWLSNYRFDGLRLDAAHAIVEPGEPNVLNELAAAVDDLAQQSGRHIHLVLENDDNAARFLVPRGGYRAQWNDDYHHAWHVQLTGESTGYYCDYSDVSAHIARTLAEGFAYQGEASPHRGGKIRGEPSKNLPRGDFVNFIQNHDQIGNRPMGERLSGLAEPRALEAALTVLLLQPSPPLMFMGDEWGAIEPFPFFCDFKGISPKPYGEAAGVSSPKPTPGTAMKSPTLFRGDTPDGGTRLGRAPEAGTCEAPRAHARAAGGATQWIAPLLPPMREGGAATLEGGCAARPLAGRHREPFAARQFIGGRNSETRPTRLGHADLGRKSPSPTAALVCLRRDRRRADAAGDTDRDLPHPADQGFRL